MRGKRHPRAAQSDKLQNRKIVKRQHQMKNGIKSRGFTKTYSQKGHSALSTECLPNFLKKVIGWLNKNQDQLGVGLRIAKRTLGIGFCNRTFAAIVWHWPYYREKRQPTKYLNCLQPKDRLKSMGPHVYSHDHCKYTVAVPSRDTKFYFQL